MMPVGMDGNAEGADDAGAERPPRSCPPCGQDLSEHPYYQLVPSPTARLVRKVAAALLPVMAVAYLAQLFWGTVHFGFGTGHGYSALLVVAGPSLILYAISRLFPRRHLVICQRCSWNREVPASEIDITAQSVPIRPASRRGQSAERTSARPSRSR